MVQYFFDDLLLFNERDDIHHGLALWTGCARFWRVDKEAHYGPLNNLAWHNANVEKIHNNWDDFLRLAGSLKLGLVHSYNLIRTLQKGDKTTELQKGLENFGRINKTIYMLNIMDDPAFRRRILSQLNIHEGRHKLARTIFYGRRGQLRKQYREGQEDQLGALGLVTNVIVLWNTLYMNSESIQSGSLRPLYFPESPLEKDLY
jgi:TnpA family transposase